MRAALFPPRQHRWQWALLVLVIPAALILLSACPQSLIFASACARPVRLAELFPSLLRLSQTPALTITVGWGGLADISSIRVKYTLEQRGDRFEGRGQGVVERRGGRGNASAVREVAVPAGLVRAFLAASSQVPLTEGEYKPRITHTDDYPLIRVEAQTEEGLLRLETSSQRDYPNFGGYPDRTPWALKYRHRTFIITVNDLDQAWDVLLPHLHYREISDEASRQLLLASQGVREPR
jgi:hypothetical protein